MRLDYVPLRIAVSLFIYFLLKEACSSRRVNQSRTESLVWSLYLSKITFLTIVLVVNRNSLYFGVICVVERSLP